MLLAVPDAISCPPGDGRPARPRTRRRRRTTTATTTTSWAARRTASLKPNGVDFWWDEFPSNTGNCWYNNIGPDGTNASWTGDPQRFAKPGMSVPRLPARGLRHGTGHGRPGQGGDARLLRRGCDRRTRAATGTRRRRSGRAPRRPRPTSAAQEQRSARPHSRRSASPLRPATHLGHPELREVREPAMKPPHASDAGQSRTPGAPELRRPRFVPRPGVHARLAPLAVAVAGHVAGGLAMAEG